MPGVTTMCALGLLNRFNISICATDVSSDSGGCPKHFYSDTADLTEGQIAIKFWINSLFLSMSIPSKSLDTVTQM